MITAEEKLRVHLHGFSDEQLNEFTTHFPGVEIKYAMIEFAKIHVEAALEAAANNSVKMSSTKSTIMNSYPLENIK